MSSKKFAVLLVLVAAVAGLFPQTANAATFTVNSTNDPGAGGCTASECTLREAITAANVGATSADTINFNIPGPGPHTITIAALNPLPGVTRNVTIDATTEPDYAGTPVVELNGTLAGPFASGLRLVGSGGIGQSTVKGLAINRFGNLGISVESASNTVQANHIGTNTTGTVPLGNGTGVQVTAASNLIGGTTAAARNVISGNTGEGLRIQAASNTVQGNYIGTDASGTLPLGNGAGSRGLLVISGAAANNTIGGTTAGARNVISANGGGIWVTIAGPGNTIQGNYIGTNAAGTAPLGNASEGVIIQATPNTLVGGTTPGARNVISGNGRGVVIQGTAATGNRVEGNFIGTDSTGTSPLPNTFDGVRFHSSGSPGGPPSGNTIGGTAAGAGNTIAFNGAAGVSVETGVRNAILSNSIFSNGSLGIDLFPFGPTPNDPGDGDTGANELQNFPVITDATTDSSTTTVEGTLNSRPTTTYRIEVFSSPSCDPSGFGEGRTFRTSLSVTTDGSGNASFTANAGAVPEGHVITATATDPNGNTSEFSACREVEPAGGTPTTLTLSPKADSNPVGTSHTVTATVSDEGGSPVSGVVVRFSVTGSVTTSGSCTTDDSGQCDFTYEGPTSPGADAITAFADTDGNGTQDPGEPGDAASKIWAAAAPDTLVLTPPADTNPVGTSHTVTATVRDAFGNPTSGITVRFSVTGAATASGSCTTDAAGECTFTYDGPMTPGVDAISAFADTNTDGDRDVGEPEGAAEKTWVPGDPATLMLEPAADQNPVNTQHCVIATVTDAFGNPVPGVTARFSVTGSVTTSGSATTGPDGQAEFCYQGPQTVGADVIRAFADTNDDGDQDAGEPEGVAAKTWVAGAPASVVLTPPADQNPVGTSHTVTATVRDTFGNPTPGITVEFSVTGAATASGQCTTDAAGECTFTYDGPTTPGVDAISAFADTNDDDDQDAGEPAGTAAKTWVPGPPATVVLTPAADENPVGTSHTVTATVRDVFGNPTPGITVEFSVTGAATASGSCTTDAAGECTFTYGGPTSPGVDAISAFADTNDDGDQDAGEPQGAAQKTWVPGPPATVVLTPAADENPVGTSHTVTATVRDVFGNPTPGITVRFSVTGSVTASGQCTTNAQGQCDFTYSGPELPGADAITAYADTDGDGTQDAGEPQGAAEKTWVLPVSTPLCEVTISDGGRITANNGDRATFGGNAKVSAAGQASGEQTYQDHGPAQRLTFKSTEVLAVTCSADRKDANIYGVGTVDGSGNHFFLIQVRDAGKSGRNDTYRILIATGYDSGTHRLEGGNVTIK